MPTNDTANILSSEYRNGGSTPTTAAGVSYDNTESGLTATNVQTAIDELKNDIPTIPATYAAEDVTYDNTTSELTATNAQAAIDEVDGKIDSIVNVQGFAWVEQHVVQIETDATKTIGENLAALYTAALDYISTLTGKYHAIKQVAVNNNWLPPLYYSITNSTGLSLDFTRTHVGQTETLFRVVYLEPSLKAFREVTLSSASVYTYKNYDTDLATAGAEFSVVFDIFEKIE